jgi:hypothetical protein
MNITAYLKTLPTNKLKETYFGKGRYLSTTDFLSHENKLIYTFPRNGIPDVITNIGVFSNDSDNISAIYLEIVCGIGLSKEHKILLDNRYIRAIPRPLNIFSAIKDYNIINDYIPLCLIPTYDVRLVIEFKYGGGHTGDVFVGYEYAFYDVCVTEDIYSLNINSKEVLNIQNGLIF